MTLNALHSLHRKTSAAISWSLLLVVGGCVSTQQTSSQTPGTQGNTPSIYSPTTNKQKCQTPHPELSAGQAVVIDGSNFFVTGFSKTCGKRVEQDSDFALMGLPCSGGNGTFDFRGERKKASLVRFHMDVGCPMKNSSPAIASSIVRSAVGLASTAQPTAINAMSVQVWEVPSFADLGVGEYVALRTMAGVQFFKDMNETTPLRVKLYGKENSWIPSKQWYEMEANIYISGYTSFRTELISAKIMNRSDKRSLKKRCLRSRSAAACKAVLSEDMNK